MRTFIFDAEQTAQRTGAYFVFKKVGGEERIRVSGMTIAALLDGQKPPSDTLSERAWSTLQQQAARLEETVSAADATTIVHVAHVATRSSEK